MEDLNKICKAGSYNIKRTWEIASDSKYFEINHGHYFKVNHGYRYNIRPTICCVGYSAGKSTSAQYNKVVSKGSFVGGVTHNLDLSDLEG